jgi:hypothetical protein
MRATSTSISTTARTGNARDDKRKTLFSPRARSSALLSLFNLFVAANHKLQGAFHLFFNSPGPGKRLLPILGSLDK